MIHEKQEIGSIIKADGVVRFAGNADVRIRSQRKSHSYADEDVRVPSQPPILLGQTPT
jgi:hypothetical protein